MQKYRYDHYTVRLYNCMLMYTSNESLLEETARARRRRRLAVPERNGINSADAIPCGALYI